MVVLIPVLLACSSAVLSIGCGGSSDSQAPSADANQGRFQLLPGTANLTQGFSVTFVPTGGSGTISPAGCTWQVGNNTVLSPKGNGEFVGTGIGSSSVIATCGENTSTASVLVSATANPTAIRITSGGTYSGNWSSPDPKIPVVTILTNEPVTLRNATLTGRGDLIDIYGSKGGANVTIDNVTGTALDPGVTGVAKGKFVSAEVVSSLSVRHCTMHNISFGIYVASSRLASLIIKNNVAYGLDDRKSDGDGRYLLNQRVLGHFIQFNGVSLPNGGEIAWNQMINSDGTASVEDILNFYESHGSAANPVLVHDNYLEGGFASGQTSYYTGAGIQMDGDSNDASTASGFVTIANNTIVHLAGDGISIAAGHDINVTGNRIVSCGKDSSGNWIANPGSSALGMWNYYRSKQYFNNYMANNSGGLVKPDANGNPSPGDWNVPGASETLKNVLGPNVFDQPCLANYGLNLGAESIEKNKWLSKVANAGESLGDQQ